MKQKKILIMLILCIAILVLGIGYAVLSGTNLVIEGNLGASSINEQLEVEFLEAFVHSKPEDVVAEATIDVNNTKKGHISISNLKTLGDKVILYYYIKNDSMKYDAQLETPTISYTKTEWFDISCEYVKDIIPHIPRSDAYGMGRVMVTVELIKEPQTVEEAAETHDDITIEITATPVDREL